ncbi:MAG TPA: Sir2 family NAD-dependent protein deacetylase [Burkholderiaceae bacterium]
MGEIDQAALLRAADLIADADALVIAAGAGIGIDSGLPDFRGASGFWRAYPALGAAGMAFHEIASPAAFRRDLALAWGFYGHRLALYRDTVPHAGFALLRKWGGRMPHGSRVYTSNVDGQFQRAGFDGGQIAECHGSIHHLQCLARCGDAVWSADGYTPQVDATACRLRNAPPACPHCGGPARPNVLMFNDWDWVAARTDAQLGALDSWLGSVRRPVVLEIGAGTAIPSVRRFGHRVVEQCGGRLVRINPDDDSVPHRADIAIAARALPALEALGRLLG